MGTKELDRQREVTRSSAVADAVARVRDRMEAAALRAGRDPSTVELVCVSKGVPPDRIAEALAAGARLFGENRVQEARAKWHQVPGATWHLVGHLQRNKVSEALEQFAVIHSVDTSQLASRLAALLDARRSGDIGGGAHRLPVYLQVNVDQDPSKRGFSPDGLRNALAELAILPGLELRGLMTVGRLTAAPEEARLTFVALSSLSLELRRQESALGPGLSMGMSDDLEIAVEEGATIVRVGRAIFPERPIG